MQKAFGLSLVLHFVVIGLLFWSDRLSFLLHKSSRPELLPIEAILIDKTYKPTDTAMRQGDTKKDLPPPKVEPKKEEEVVTKASKNVKEKKPDAKRSAKNDVKDILKRLRKEADDERPAPKVDNLPTTEKGEKDATGTGGNANRTLSPAELAVSSAIRRYYELTNRAMIAKTNPKAQVYIRVRLTANGDKLAVVSMQLEDSSGIDILDRQCQIAIRQALASETFAPDVINALSGKEKYLTCQP